MITRGIYKEINRTHFSHGDFSEGIQIYNRKLDITSGWIGQKEIYPIVQRGIEGNFPESLVRDSNGEVFKLTKQECEDITEHWIDQVCSFIEGKSLTEKIGYLKLGIKEKINLIL